MAASKKIPWPTVWAIVIAAVIVAAGKMAFDFAKEKFFNK